VARGVSGDTQLRRLPALHPVSDLPALPFERPHALAIPPLLRKLQSDSPITRVRTPAGDAAWYVTRYAEVKQLLGDSRLGLSHQDPERAPRITDSVWCGGPVENYETEHADHVRMRALLTPFFSARRMESLRPRVETLVDQLLDDLAASRRPVDLHEAVSLQLPALVIGQLLGLPPDDRDRLRVWSRDVADLHHRHRGSEALRSLNRYMGELVARKRANPGDDVISGLCAVENGTLADDHIATLAATLLFAGHETTVVRIDMGVLLLLANHDQRSALLRDPSLLAGAVEEVLRASATGGAGMPRYARADIEVGDVKIRAGDAVLLDRGAANHDERAFDDPDRFEVARTPNLHLTFGHGARFCIGAPLARIELQAVLGRLIPRFPSLRLTTPIEQLRTRDDMLTGGLAGLPVTW
jgi:cytochrome P450